MADTKISALTVYTTPIATDVLPIVDVTAVGTKKIAYSDIGKFCAVVTTSISRSATTNDAVILCDVTSAILTVTLPTAVGITGRKYVIKDWKGQAATHNITIATTSAQTIDGASTKVINSNYGSYSLVSDGANWSVT